MSLNLNTVLLAGHLTRDPEIKPLAGDKVVASFAIAINRRFKGSDGAQKEECTFIECEAWGRTAELIGQYLAKGSACFLEGRLKLDNWQDKDGVKRNKIKVVADSVQFIGKPKHGTEGEPAGGEPTGGNEPSQAPSARTSAPSANASRSTSAPQPRGRTVSAGTSATSDEPPF